ncbi:VOC family protein [Brevibacterium sp. CFH 10365]|uniref:VOC family protein n=1 Tax=Brevibacterium sp. CFH 10365 TaxID=2585207 RepID=UPI00126628B4|nr:VOC family protein [Brevibacterium sp. CFH 10365]
MFNGLMANIAIRNEKSATEWYSRLFERQPDARPMAGLVEWRFDEKFGIQIWEDPQRAGGSAVVIDVDDLDAVDRRLRSAGIDHDEPSPGGGRRILPITDPDGNQVVFFGE